ncbi:UNVERIFIED_ORG: hypothetical protein ABID57_002312 [Arthrobacter sp. UYEF1]
MANFFGELFHDPAHGGMRGSGFSPLDGAGHVNVQLQRIVMRQVGHQPVLRPAGEDLGYKCLELGKHGVAGCLEDGGMEFHVQPEEIVAVAALPGRPDRCRRPRTPVRPLAGPPDGSRLPP